MPTERQNKSSDADTKGTRTPVERADGTACKTHTAQKRTHNAHTAYRAHTAHTQHTHRSQSAHAQHTQHTQHNKSFRSSRLVPRLLATCCECCCFFLVLVHGKQWTRETSKHRCEACRKCFAERDGSEETMAGRDPSDVEWTDVDSSSMNGNGNEWTESTPAKETDTTGTSTRSATACEVTPPCRRSSGSLEDDVNKLAV